MDEILRKDRDIPWQSFENCHDGEGAVLCKSLLDNTGSEKFRYMHFDNIKKDVSIGEHPHTDNEEIYYLVSGKGILLFDGQEYEMRPGDVSLCRPGHSHGFIAAEDSILIVVA